jgi:hypothetical protein
VGYGDENIFELVVNGNFGLQRRKGETKTSRD